MHHTSLNIPACAEWFDVNQQTTFPRQPHHPMPSEMPVEEDVWLLAAAATGRTTAQELPISLNIHQISWLDKLLAQYAAQYLESQSTAAELHTSFEPESYNLNLSQPLPPPQLTPLPRMDEDISEYVKMEDYIEYTHEPPEQLELSPTLSASSSDCEQISNAHQVRNSGTSYSETDRSNVPTNLECASPSDPIYPNSDKRPRKVRLNTRNLTCFNCGTNTTPLWRRTADRQHSLCNACGLYFKQYQCHRPRNIRQKVIDQLEEDHRLPSPPADKANKPAMLGKANSKNTTTILYPIAKRPQNRFFDHNDITRLPMGMFKDRLVGLTREQMMGMLHDLNQKSEYLRSILG